MGAVYEAICHNDQHVAGVIRMAKKLLAEGPVHVKVQHVEEKRRNAQNRRYWALMHQIAEQLKVNGLQMDPESWHEWAKRRFIGVREIVLPDGEIVALGQSSTELSVRAFGDYMECLEAWATDQGVIFNDLPEVG
jgi:hypothetical protein